MIFTLWLGSGRRVLAAGVVGAAAARGSEAPLGIALAAGGDRQVCKDRGQDRCCTSCDSGAVGDKKHLLMKCPATDFVRQRFSCLSDLAVPPCMPQLVWGGNRMMVAEFMLACLEEVGLIGSSAHSVSST